VYNKCVILLSKWVTLNAAPYTYVSRKYFLFTGRETYVPCVKAGTGQTL